MSEVGYVYILSNEHIPKLVKIGYTNRNPSDRADELSNFTGVPGKWMVRKYWKLNNAFEWEQKIFGALRQYRETGEFFSLTPKKAIELVFIFLSNSGAINEDGLTTPEKIEAAEARALHAEFEEKTRLDGLNKQWKLIESQYFQKSLEEAEAKTGLSLNEINRRGTNNDTDIFETIGNLLYVICIPVIVPISLLLSIFGISLFDQPKQKEQSVADKQRDKLFFERDKILENYKNNFFVKKNSPGLTSKYSENKNGDIQRVTTKTIQNHSTQTIYSINGKPHIYDGAQFIEVKNLSTQSEEKSISNNFPDVKVLPHDEWRMTPNGLQNLSTNDLIATHLFEYVTSPIVGYKIYSTSNFPSFIPYHKVKPY